MRFFFFTNFILLLFSFFIPSISFTTNEMRMLFKPTIDLLYYSPFDAQLDGDTLYVLYGGVAVPDDNFVAVFKKNEYGEWSLEKTFLRGELSFPHTINFYSDDGLLISDTGNGRVIIINKESGEMVWDSKTYGLLFGHPNDAEWKSEEAGKIFVSHTKDTGYIFEIKIDDGIITNAWEIKDNALFHDIDIIDSGNIRYVDSTGFKINEMDRWGEIVRSYSLNVATNWPRNTDEITVKGKKFIFASDLDKIVRIKPDGEEVFFIEERGDKYNFHLTSKGILAHNYSQVYLIDYLTKSIKWSLSLQKEDGNFTNSMERYEILKSMGYVQ